jgi:membrane protease YdiL (CAAX protease family)
MADGETAAIGTVLVTIVATAAAGVILCEARRRSDSLLAPIGLHWAVNGLGVLAVALASST